MTLLLSMLLTPALAQEECSVFCDVLLVGTNDLCMEMGIPGDFGNEKVSEAYRKVVSACKAHGKHPGMGGVYAPDLMKRYIDIGAGVPDFQD